jgi:hypothetical protein
MNFFSYYIRSLLHQNYRNPHTQFTGYRNDSHSGSDVSWMSAADRAKEFPKLRVLADRRPGTLDEFTSQPRVPQYG